jgi:hypothetical protein
MMHLAARTGQPGEYSETLTRQYILYLAASAPTLNPISTLSLNPSFEIFKI